MEQEKEQTAIITVTALTPQGRKSTDETVCRELPLAIYVNGSEVATVLCSPADLEDLVFGFAFSEGIIETAKDVKALEIDHKQNTARLTTTYEYKPKSGLSPLIATGGGRLLQKAQEERSTGKKLFASARQIACLMEGFLQNSRVYSATRGIHSAAIASPEEIIICRDDIGRHNALDKVFGSSIRQGINLQEYIVITSGRISSEMLLKAASHGCPILLTKAAPTDMGVKLAEKLGVTLVRYARDLTITVYCHDWRVRD